MIKITETTTALELICKLHKGMSRQKAKKIIKSSTFMCEGKALKTIPSTLFTPGQEIEIIRNTVTNLKNEHPGRVNPIIIKFEDEHIIVAIKPVGLLSCKNQTQKGVSFDKMLKEYVSKRDGLRTELWIAHRIDREVEGLIIFAKSEAIQQKIKDSWQDVTKKYLALTEGIPAPPSGIIESWLRDGFKHKMNIFKKEVEGSKFAKTGYELIKQIGKYSLIEITLHTGRKNQICKHSTG